MVLAMRPQLQHVDPGAGASFLCEIVQEERFSVGWHEHPHVELVIITQGHGTRFVGDLIEPFKASEAALLGPHLPHVYASADDCEQSEALVLQFTSAELGERWLAAPEMAAVQKLLRRSERGLLCQGLDQVAQLEQAFRRLHAATGITRMRELCALFELICTLNWDICSNVDANWEHCDPRLGSVIDFCLREFQRPIPMRELAALIGMRSDSFSRFFQRHMGCSCVQMLNQLRCREAARLLRDKNDSITNIAFASGFGTISNFNKQFHERYGMSPRAYRQHTRSSLS